MHLVLVGLVVGIVVSVPSTAGLDLLGAAVLVGVAVHLMRTPLETDGAVEEVAPIGDLLTGLLLGTLNGTRILTWSVTASVLAVALADVGPLGLLVYAASAAAGEVLWYGLLALARSRFGPMPRRFHWWTVRGSAGLAFLLAGGLAGRSLRTLGPAIAGAL